MGNCYTITGASGVANYPARLSKFLQRDTLSEAKWLPHKQLMRLSNL